MTRKESVDVLEAIKRLYMDDKLREFTVRRLYTSVVCRVTHLGRRGPFSLPTLMSCCLRRLVGRRGWRSSWTLQSRRGRMSSRAAPRRTTSTRGSCAVRVCHAPASLYTCLAVETCTRGSCAVRECRAPGSLAVEGIRREFIQAENPCVVCVHWAVRG